MYSTGRADQQHSQIDEQSTKFTFELHRITGDRSKMKEDTFEDG